MAHVAGVRMVALSEEESQAIEHDSLYDGELYAYFDEDGGE
jgi:hypothetical protein